MKTLCASENRFKNKNKLLKLVYVPFIFSRDKLVRFHIIRNDCSNIGRTHYCTFAVRNKKTHVIMFLQ